MSSMFSAPAEPGAGIKFQDHNGALLLFDVHGLEANINTSFGVTDAVKATVHVLDGAGAPETYDETLIFPKILRSQLNSKVGEKVLGRLGQGTQKPGQSAPWILNPASAEDQALAERWLTQNVPSVTSAAPPF